MTDSNPYAKTLQQQKYRQRVKPNKKKTKGLEGKDKYDEEMRNWWWHNRMKAKSDEVT